MKTFALIVTAILLTGCPSPILYEHRDLMVADPAYQQYGIPQKYILRVDRNGLDDVETPAIRINGAYNWLQMSPLSPTETAGLPAGYEYYRYIFTGLNSNVNSVTYEYRCEYEGWTLFGYRILNVKLGPFVIEKPIWLKWKVPSDTEWHPSYNDNLTSNAVITNQGCFSIADVNKTKSIEALFTIRNEATTTMYINHQLTKIIDRATGNETVNADRFVVESMGPFSNNLIDVSPSAEVGFKMKYIVTIAGPGDIQDRVKLRFSFGDSNTSFNKTFDVGADLKFIRQDSCP